MALSDCTAAYTDCYTHFERAGASTKGIRILLNTAAEAQHLRFRLYQARKLERVQSMRVYTRADPQYGKSINDRFRITIQPTAEGDGKCWVYIEPWDQEFEDVEEL